MEIALAGLTDASEVWSEWRDKRSRKSPHLGVETASYCSFAAAAIVAIMMYRRIGGFVKRRNPYRS
jgi:hypothetical protein